jgi:hypothetical protein
VVLPKGTIVVTLAGALALAFPGAAPAVETIGQTSEAFFCSQDTAYVQKTLAAGPSYSPSAYGVITSWSAIGNPIPDQSMKLLVLRPDGGTQFSIVARDTTARVFTNLNALNTFTGLRVPIEPSQRLGLYLPPGSDSGPCEFMTGNAGDVVGFLSTPVEPPDNAPFAYSGNDSPRRLNAQAAVEPDTDRDVFGDETQDKCVGTPGQFNGCPNTVTIGKLKQKGDKKVKVTATVPGTGTLKVGSASDPALASAAAKKSIKAVTKNLTTTTKQQIKLTLKLTKSAIGKLDDQGKLKLKVKAVYTPVGGPPGSQTKKKKLRS